ncbi:MAG: primosomal protein N' [Pseudomonadota bacterium]
MTGRFSMTARAISQASPSTCQVAVPVPLSRSFDYLWPFDEPPVPGMLVEVPFARRQLKAVVLGAGGGHLDVARLKPVTRFWPTPALDAEQLALARWCSRYYHHPLGEVLNTMLPKAWDNPAAPETELVLTPSGRMALDAGQVRGGRQQQALSMLAQQPMARSRLQEAGISSAVIRTLLSSERVTQQTVGSTLTVSCGPELTPAQLDAVNRIREASGFAAHLLYGVTGSGKTEVYLELIAEIAAAGRQCLVVVPEIGLTPQLARRFLERLGSTVAVLHSGLGDRERARSWQRAADGDAQVIIGTRSAVFCPLPKAGLLVVDEEHDLSLKQHEGFRYSARDVAVQRARELAVPVILGSATPSLESLNNAWSDRYRYHRLDQRPGAATLPSVELIDSRGCGSDGALTPVAREALHEVLAKDEQALVFLNRRGFAPTLLCDACGWVAECPSCDSRLTLHRAVGQLRCHHCGYSQRAPTACPECRSTRLVPLGLGTQRVEQTLSEEFPDRRIWRVDRDSVRSRRRLLQLLEEIGSGDSGILVGTQMLAKGHDFPNVTLVVVLNIDHALFSADFRAAERAAQLMVQVSGRAGRADKPGRVLIQTHQPDHPMFAGILERGYLAYARDLMTEREAAAYPPAGFLAVLRANAPQRSLAENFVSAAMARLGRPAEVELLGPLPSPMERRAGHYHLQVLLSSRRRQPLHSLLDRCLPAIAELPQGRRVRWSVDVDPQDLF